MFKQLPLNTSNRYLVLDYDPFSLSLGVLTFQNKKPSIGSVVRGFFGPDDRILHPKSFREMFLYLVKELSKKIEDLPREICLIMDHGEMCILTSGFTFPREDFDIPISHDEVNTYIQKLVKQAHHVARRIWHEDLGYLESDRHLLSLFLTHFALDKKHHLFPIGKHADHVTIRCLFFYGNDLLVRSIREMIHLSGFECISCVPLSMVFLNHLCNQKTFHENNIHIHLGYDSTSIILHLGKQIQEIQMMPFGWKILDEKLSHLLSPLERESLLLGDKHAELSKYHEYADFTRFMKASLSVLLERFELNFSFREIYVSTQGPFSYLSGIVSQSYLSPYIQKFSEIHRFVSDPDTHWISYCQTLDPLFSLHPHPLLSLVRSIIPLEHENH